MSGYFQWVIILSVILIIALVFRIHWLTLIKNMGKVAIVLYAFRVGVAIDEAFGGNFLTGSFALTLASVMLVGLNYHWVLDQRKPSRLKYFWVCIFFLIIKQFMELIVYSLTALVMIKNVSNLTTYILIVMTLSVPIGIITFIYIYNAFSTLNIKLVMPYIYVLGAIGTLIELAALIDRYRLLNTNPNYPASIISSILAYITLIYTIRTYYRNKPDRWY